MVVEDERPVAETPSIMSFDPSALELGVPAAGERMRTIELVAGQIVTRRGEAVARVADGRVVSDPSRDLLKLVVVDRYSGRARTGVGFVRGFGMARGAIAASVAHDAHNVIAVGVDDADIRAAVTAFHAMGGGLVAAAGGEARARLALPVAGLMSPEPLETVRRGLDRLNAVGRDLGGRLRDPFMTLSFLALPVIPALKLTDRGLVDVDRFEVVPLFL